MRSAAWLVIGEQSPAIPVQELVDVHLVRGLLHRAELVAVKTARRHGKSWSDIATMLHMTRQSAWERWHDIDDNPEASTYLATAE
jgi:hypothetical protein